MMLTFSFSLHAFLISSKNPLKERAQKERNPNTQEVYKGKSKTKIKTKINFKYN